MADSLLGGRNLLIVEDEMLVLMSIETMLADLGCTSITAAATVHQALSLLPSHVFDAAILDVNLNGHESYPVACALAARGVPFAFSTGYSDTGMREDYRRRPVLRKPYRTSQLVEVLTDLLAV